MTTYTGLCPDVGTADFTSYTSVTQNITPPTSLSFIDASEACLGSENIGQPVWNSLTRPDCVGMAYDYVDYLYGQIWIVPFSISTGAVLRELVYEVEVWNAALYDETRTIYEIAATNDGGLDLYNAAVIPYVMAAGESLIYTLTVSTDGPSTISAEFIFKYTDGVNYNESTLNVDGTRLVIWGYMPQQTFKERMEWLSEVFTAFDTTETVQSLRTYPRVSFVYDYVKDDVHVSNKMHNTLKAYQYINFGIPQWSDLVTVLTPISAGTTDFYFDTSIMDIDVGDSLFIWGSDILFEAINVSEVHADHVVTDFGCVNDYSFVILSPLKLSKAPRQLDINFLKKIGLSSNYEFNVIYPEDIGSTDLPDQYGGLDLLLDATLIDSDKSTITILNDFDELDNKSGIFDYVYHTTYSKSILPYKKYFSNKSAIVEFKQWLNKMVGKVGQFWVVGQTLEALMSGSAVSTSSSIDVMKAGLAAVFNNLAEMHMVIELSDGTILLRQVLNVVEGSTTEAITFTEQHGVNFTANDIVRLARLYKVRLAEETVTFEYDWLNSCYVSLKVEEIVE